MVLVLVGFIAKMTTVGLASEELQLRDQARSSRVPEEGESLLKE
jgi:hypothetical protein